MQYEKDPNARTAYALTAFLMCFVVLILLFREGQYSWETRLSPIRDGMTLVRSMLIAYLIVQGAAFATKGFFTGFDDFSRLAELTSMLLLFGLLFGARLVMWRHQRGLLESGITLRRVIVVGSGRAATDFVNFLEKRPWLGVRCMGAIGLNHKESETVVRSAAGTVVRNVGSLVDARSILAEKSADEFVVALDPEEYDRLRTVTETLTRERLPFKVVPSLFEESYRPARLVGFEELPVIDMEVDALDQVQRTFKRWLDLAVGRCRHGGGLSPDGGRRAGDQGHLHGTGLLRAGAARPEREALPGAEVPDDGRRRRGPPARAHGEERGRGSRLQDQARSKAHSGGRLPAQVEPGRDSRSSST